MDTAWLQCLRWHPHLTTFASSTVLLRTFLQFWGRKNRGYILWSPKESEGSPLDCHLFRLKCNCPILYCITGFFIAILKSNYHFSQSSCLKSCCLNWHWLKTKWKAKRWLKIPSHLFQLDKCWEFQRKTNRLQHAGQWWVTFIGEEHNDVLHTGWKTLHNLSHMC